MPFLGERVGMTEAARLHFDSNLSRPGLRNLSLDHFKRSAGPTHLDDAHVGHTCSPRTADSLSVLTRPSFMLPPVPVMTHTFPESLPDILRSSFATMAGVRQRDSRRWRH